MRPTQPRERRGVTGRAWHSRCQFGIAPTGLRRRRTATLKEFMGASRQRVRCDRCGSARSRFSSHALCLACARLVPHLQPTLAPEPDDSGFAPKVRQLAGGGILSVGAVLRRYRNHHSLTQSQLGELLGISQEQVSKIERGKRSVTSRDSLLRIARALSEPPEKFGVTEDEHVPGQRLDLELAAAVITLARVARLAGNPAAAHGELTPLLRRMNDLDLAAVGWRDGALLAAEGHLVLGLVLGELLPEHALGSARVQLQRALDLAEGVDLEPGAAGYIEAFLGNQFRMVGRYEEALRHLAAAHKTAPTPVERGTYAALLARTAGEASEDKLFQRMIADAKRALGEVEQRTALFSEGAITEIEARGLLRFGRLRDATYVLRRTETSGDPPGSPQWAVITLITRAEASLAYGRSDRAVEDLEHALVRAISLQLPHQVQRVYRLLQLAETPNVSRLRLKAREHLSVVEARLGDTG